MSAWTWGCLILPHGTHQTPQLSPLSLAWQSISHLPAEEKHLAEIKIAMFASRWTRSGRR